MADFSVQATQLSAPQGAGSTPIQAVTAPGAISPSLFQQVGTVFDVLAKGAADSAKADAKRREDTAVNGYIRAETIINDAVESGQMSSSQASARSRANFNQYAAGYGEYIGSFEKAGKALRGFTAAGEVEDQLKTEKARREADINQARARGYSIPPNSSQSTIDAQVNASQVGMRAEQQLAAKYKADEAARATGTYDAAVAAREDKDMASKVIGDVAGANLQAFQSLAKELGDKVRSGAMTQEQGQILLNERYSNINAAIVAAAGKNPELAGAYRSVFESVYVTGQSLAKPVDKNANLEKELTNQTLKLKLIAMSDPQTAAAVVSNQLFSNSPAIAISLDAVSRRVLTQLSNLPSGTKDYVPQVVGNPEAEAGVLKGLTQGFKDIASGNVTDKEIAITQNSNSVNQILTQAGAVIDQYGATPQKLTKLATFLASSDYASFVKQGKIDPQAAGTAAKTFQLLYAPAVVDGVQTRMNDLLPRFEQQGVNGPIVNKPTTPINEIVNIKFTGSGIVFEPINKPGMVYSEQRGARQVIESLKSSQAGINQLIHIGAHLEGKTDYAKQWEEHRHEYFPGYFLKGLKEGDVRGGYKYLGGNASLQSSYQKVADAASK